jgi:hypothetical protein
MKNEKLPKDHPFKIMIDQRPYDWSDQLITGSQIKQLASVDMSYGVWLKVQGPGEDQPIEDQEQVDLSKPGREHFFTAPTQTTEG